MRHPEHHVRERPAGEVDGLPRPGDVREHERRLAGEETRERVVHRRGRIPGEREDVVRHERARPRAKRGDARPDRLQSRAGRPQIHRELQEHEPESVPE